MKTVKKYTLEQKMDYYENKIAIAREELAQCYKHLANEDSKLRKLAEEQVSDLEDELYFYRGRLFTIYSQWIIKGLVRPR